MIVVDCNFKYTAAIKSLESLDILKKTDFHLKNLQF